MGQFPPRPFPVRGNMGAFQDLTGQVFGRLTVLERGPDKDRDNGKNVVMWSCKCSCGNKTLVAGGSLKSGRTMSCGCLQRERTSIISAEYRISSMENTVRHYWNKCKNRARKKGIPFTLTKKQVGSLIFQNCHYCGQEPKQSFGTKNYQPYNGLDRMDSDKGYTIDNVVPCCGNCNRHKRLTLYNIFFAIMDRGIRTFLDPEA